MTSLNREAKPHGSIDTLRPRNAHLRQRVALWAASVMFAAVLPSTTSSQDRPPDTDDESKERLIRKTKGESGDDVMARIIHYMDQASERLGNTFDTGAGTQQIHRRILKELELAIRQAKQNMRVSRSSAQQKGEKRPEGETSDGSRGDQDRTRAGSEDADGGSSGPGDDIELGKNGALRERRRQWGHLPTRDRDEIIQGSNEEVHEKYRRQIERYYEALADPEFDQ